MGEFFNSFLFFMLLTQSVAYLSDKHIDGLANEQGLSTPFFYDTLYYNIHIIATPLIMIITTIVCCVNYSWWIIVVGPLTIYFASSILGAITNIVVLRIVGVRWYIARFIFFLFTVLFNIILVYMWFK